MALKRRMRKYIWHNIMLEEGILKRCPYCGRYFRRSEILRHFRMAHTEVYEKVRNEIVDRYDF
jgi:uncharacterized C2H2 Zn-finger protein